MIPTIVTKGKVLDYIPSYTFKLFYLSRYYSSFNCVSVLTILIVPSIVSFLFIIYISAFFKLFLLLYGPLKYLSLLKSLVWPLPFRSSPISIVICVVWEGTTSIDEKSLCCRSLSVGKDSFS